MGSIRGLRINRYAHSVLRGKLLKPYCVPHTHTHYLSLSLSLSLTLSLSLYLARAPSRTRFTLPDASTTSLTSPSTNSHPPSLLLFHSCTIPVLWECYTLLGIVEHLPHENGVRESEVCVSVCVCVCVCV